MHAVVAGSTCGRQKCENLSVLSDFYCVTGGFVDTWMDIKKITKVVCSLLVCKLVRWLFFSLD